MIFDHHLDVIAGIYTKMIHDVKAVKGLLGWMMGSIVVMVRNGSSWLIFKKTEMR